MVRALRNRTLSQAREEEEEQVVFEQYEEDVVEEEVVEEEEEEEEDSDGHELGADSTSVDDDTDASSPGSHSEVIRQSIVDGHTHHRISQADIVKHSSSKSFLGRLLSRANPNAAHPVPAHWRTELRETETYRSTDFCWAVLWTLLILLLLWLLWHGTLFGFDALAAFATRVLSWWAAAFSWLWYSFLGLFAASSAAQPAYVAPTGLPELDDLRTSMARMDAQLTTLSASVAGFSAVKVAADANAGLFSAQDARLAALAADLDALRASLATVQGDVGSLQAGGSELKAAIAASCTTNCEDVAAQIEAAAMVLRGEMQANSATLRGDLLAAMRSMSLEEAEGMREGLEVWLAAALAPYATKEFVRAEVRGAIDTYHSDIIDRTDYARHTRGSCIVYASRLTSMTYGRTEPYNKFTTAKGLLVVAPDEGDPLDGRQSPLAILHEDTSPGQCWCFSGSSGSVAISLAQPIVVDGVSIDQPARPPLTRTAPKRCTVWGLASVDDPAPVNLGEFEFNEAGHYVQSFPLESNGEAFPLVRLEVHSNHGNPDKTCLYRFRVHGVEA